MKKYLLLFLVFLFLPMHFVYANAWTDPSPSMLLIIILVIYLIVFFYNFVSEILFYVFSFRKVVPENYLVIGVAMVNAISVLAMCFLSLFVFKNMDDETMKMLLVESFIFLIEFALLWLYFRKLGKNGLIKEKINPGKLAMVVFLANAFSCLSGKFFLHLIFPGATI